MYIYIYIHTYLHECIYIYTSTNAYAHVYNVNHPRSVSENSHCPAHLNLLIKSLMELVLFLQSLLPLQAAKTKHNAETFKISYADLSNQNTKNCPDHPRDGGGKPFETQLKTIKTIYLQAWLLV